MSERGEPKLGTKIGSDIGAIELQVLRNQAIEAYQAILRDEKPVVEPTFLAVDRSSMPETEYEPWHLKLRTSRERACPLLSITKGGVGFLFPNPYLQFSSVKSAVRGFSELQWDNISDHKATFEPTQIKKVGELWEPVK